MARSGELKLHKTLKAETLWRKMLGMLFETGHPWMTFKDPCNLRSPQQHVGVVHSSNLCTEITLNTNKDEKLGRIHARGPRITSYNVCYTKLLRATLGRLDAYITGDSGPMHLSWAQGTPTLAVFGPTVKNLGFFPRGEHSRVLETALPCRPCGLHGPKACPEGHHRCMTDITPETAWDAASALLAKGRATLPEEPA